jgi:hypothetical protein
MRTEEEEAYHQLLEWGYSEEDAKAISKGLFAWVNKPDPEDLVLNDKGEK